MKFLLSYLKSLLIISAAVHAVPLSQEIPVGDSHSQCLYDDRQCRKEEWARQEHAMDLILEMAENYSDSLGSREDFDGNFEPLAVPSSTI